MVDEFFTKIKDTFPETQLGPIRTTLFVQLSLQLQVSQLYCSITPLEFQHPSQLNKTDQTL